MNVFWTETALEHLASIYTYIAGDSARYARRVVDRITARSEQIGNFPETGTRVEEYDNPVVRQVIEGPYRIIYRILEDRVDVIAVVHGARDLNRLKRFDSD